MLQSICIFTGPERKKKAGMTTTLDLVVIYPPPPSSSPHLGKKNNHQWLVLACTIQPGLALPYVQEIWVRLWALQVFFTTAELNRTEE